MFLNHRYLVIAFLLFFSVAAQSQTKDELENKKEKLQKEIKLTNTLLEKAKMEKNQSVNTLSTLNKKISSRNQVILALGMELQLYSDRIIQLQQEIEKTAQSVELLQEELRVLKAEYAVLITHAYHHRDSYNSLAFLFSADSFYQAYKRIRYLQEYSDYRKSQAQNIEAAEALLEEELIQFKTQKALVAVEKNKRTRSLDFSVVEKQLLDQEQQQQAVLLKSLKKKEKKLKTELKSKEKASKDLDIKIRKIIEDEIRKSRAIATSSGKMTFSMTPEQTKLSNDFTENKSKLPWPVERGVIIEKYGVQKHPVLAGIETFNNGIKITTETGSFVRSIFAGTVSRIINIPGAGKAIIISHGDYFSVYSNLSGVLVKSGEEVDVKQNLGLVLINNKSKESITELQIWKGSEKLDPSLWIYKAY
jgi:septal ring factor EnvC (AmiA/AmiB activator)